MLAANTAWLRSERAVSYNQLRLRMAWGLLSHGAVAAAPHRNPKEGVGVRGGVSAQFAEGGVVVGAAHDAVGVLAGAG